MIFWRALLASITIAILYLSLTPAPPSNGLGWDKLNHAGAMALVTCVAYLAGRPESRSVLFAGAYTMLLGIAVEVLQGTCTTARSAEWLDLLADAVGIFLAVLAFRVLRPVAQWLCLRRDG